MSSRKEQRLRFFEQSASQAHIADADRYLYQRKPPHLKFAFIGTGTMGVEHIRVTCLEERATVHGIFDPEPASIAMAQAELARLGSTEARVYNTLDEAIADQQVDGFVVCTPNHNHLQLLEQVLKANKPILLEKPMATELADAAAIVRLADVHPALLQIGLQYRYKPIYREAIHEAYVRRDIGQVKMISLIEHRPPFLDKVGQWNKFNRYSGGTLVEKCCHYFDLMNLFAHARPERVFASGGQAVNFVDFEYQNQRSDIADHAFVTVDYANGCRAGLNLNMFSPNFYEELVLCGDQGRLKCWEQFSHLHHGQLECEVAVELGESGASRSIQPRYPDFIEQSGHHGSTYFEHERFIDAIGGQATDAADVRQGFWSIVIGVAAEQSLASRQPVNIAALLNEHQCQDIVDG